MELSEKDATFRLEHDERTSVFRVLNAKPQAGEPESIVISPADLPMEIYGIITYHRRVVQAAYWWLLERRLPWLRKAASGGEIKGFDLLLRDRNLAGSALMRVSAYSAS